MGKPGNHGLPHGNLGSASFGRARAFGSYFSQPAARLHFLRAASDRPGGLLFHLLKYFASGIHDRAGGTDGDGDYDEPNQLCDR
jgi:hypothetical protein